MVTTRRVARPRFIANLATSVDGKIDSVKREGAGFASREDHARLVALRAETDVVVVGAATIRSENPTFAFRNPALRSTRRQAGRPEDPRIAVLSRTGNVPADASWLTEPAAARYLAVPQDLDPRATAHLQSSVTADHLEILRSGAGSVDLAAFALSLGEAGCRTALVEGGGEVVAAFLEAGLLDELRLTIVPLILGGRSAPTVVGGNGWLLNAAHRLELSSCERVDEELFLRYIV